MSQLIIQRFLQVNCILQGYKSGDYGLKEDFKGFHSYSNSQVKTLRYSKRHQGSQESAIPLALKVDSLDNLN